MYVIFVPQEVARTRFQFSFYFLVVMTTDRSCPLLGPPTSQELLWLTDPHGVSSALLPLCCAPSPFLAWLSSFQLCPLCSPSWAPLQTLYPWLLLLPPATLPCTGVLLPSPIPLAKAQASSGLQGFQGSSAGC